MPGSRGGDGRGGGSEGRQMVAGEERGSHIHSRRYLCNHG